MILKKKVRHLLHRQELNDSYLSSAYSFSRDVPLHVPVIARAAKY